MISDNLRSVFDRIRVLGRNFHSNPPCVEGTLKRLELLEVSLRLVGPNMCHSNPQNQAQPLFQSCHSPLIVCFQRSCCGQDHCDGFRVDEKRSVPD